MTTRDDRKRPPPSDRGRDPSSWKGIKRPDYKAPQPLTQGLSLGEPSSPKGVARAVETALHRLAARVSGEFRRIGRFFDAEGYYTDDRPVAAGGGGGAPAAHASTHEDGGSDEINVQGLSGVLAAAQKVTVQKDGSGGVTETILNMHDTGNCTVTVTDEGGKVGITFDVPFSLAAPGGATVVQFRHTGVGGGTILGAWNGRNLNEVQYDEMGVAVPTTGTSGVDGTGVQIRLSAGDYQVNGVGMLFGSSASQARLYDATGAAELVLGHVSWAQFGEDSHLSWVIGRFSLATDSLVEFQYQVSASQSSSGQGIDLGYDEDNLFLVFEIKRLDEELPWRDVMHVQQQQTSGSNPGNSSSAGNWVQVDLNTVLVNEISGASLASNAITLPAGTYFIESQMCGRNVTGFMSRLTDNDLGVTVLRGTNGRSTTSDVGATQTYIHGYVTIGVETDFILQFRGNATNANGMGTPCSFGDDEIYADVWIEKIR